MNDDGRTGHATPARQQRCTCDASLVRTVLVWLRTWGGRCAGYPRTLDGSRLSPRVRAYARTCAPH
eukprot:4061917-Prymnesium_polylepis.1